MKLMTISILALLISCGKKSSDSEKIVTLNQNDIVQLMEAQRFTCASLEGGKCPDGVARAFIVDQDDQNKSALCTGFLTSSNRLVTNNHCVSNEEQCANAYFAIHHQGQVETARCQRIIKTLKDDEELSDKRFDVAVIELDQHLRALPLELSNSRPSEGDEVSAWVVDHVDLYTGRITELPCLYLGTSASMEFGSCPAISGNSGSPMINQKGEVVGVLWGSTLDNSFREDIPLPVRRDLFSFSFATATRYFRSASEP